MMLRRVAATHAVDDDEDSCPLQVPAETPVPMPYAQDTLMHN